MKVENALKRPDLPSASVETGPCSFFIGENFFQNVVECSSDVILVVDHLGKVQYANPATGDFLGYEPGELIGLPVEVLVPPTIKDSHVNWRTSFTNQSEDRPMGRVNHLDARTKDGGLVPVNISLTHTELPSGKAVIVFVRDAQEQRRIYNKLVDEASKDSLTGALNRRTLFRAAEREIEQHKRYNLPVSLLMLDIDHFKSVNDSHGHEAGDAALIATSKLCQSLLRTNDIFARLGGEEFCIVAPGVAVSGARQLAERLRAELEGLEIAYGEQTLNITVSVGVSDVITTDGDINAALKRADIALYEAKRSGRNCVKENFAQAGSD